MATSNIIHEAQVCLFEVPQQMRGHRHRASLWNLKNFVLVKLQVLSDEYTSCRIKLLASAGDRKPWATCQVHAYPGPSINPVLDSNRYFVLQVQWNGGKCERVGICFETRNESKEFISTLTNYLVYGLKQNGRHENNEDENNVSSSTSSASQMSDILEEQNSSASTQSCDIPDTQAKASPEIPPKEIEKEVETIVDLPPPPVEPKVVSSDLNLSQLLKEASDAFAKLDMTDDENQNTTLTTPTTCDKVPKMNVMTEGFINRVQSYDKTVVRKPASTKDELDQLYAEIWQRAPKQLMRPMGKVSASIGPVSMKIIK